MLHISTGTLHNLRTNGTLPFTKIGGVVFYDMVAVEQMIEKHTTYQKASK
nr:helix-turn-helix domain-containing protein [Mucilaginibacter sp. E4BP6]